MVRYRFPLTVLLLLTTSLLLLLVFHVTAQGVYPLEAYRPVVLATYAHGVGDFTQGLVWDEGQLYQSAGQYGESRLQQLDLEAGTVIRELPLEETYFAEGLALVEDRLIQLTWRESTAFVYDQETFVPLTSFTYEGVGWGLCYDGETLWMSDGSSSLFQRDATTFNLISQIPVTLYGRPIINLNELECVGPYIYANIWQTDQIVRIRKSDGLVTALIDAAGLLTPEDRALISDGAGLSEPEARAIYEGSAILNGIAYIPERDTFLLTGKLWPYIFEVRFAADTGELMPAIEQTAEATASG